MTATILRGDALHLPLADQSVDLIVTSPPYFALRSYQDGGEHYAGQIGSEATPAAWLEALWAATAEMVRVLKPSGSIFVNLGDKYSGNETGGVLTAPGPGLVGSPLGMQHQRRRTPYKSGARPKSLMLLPERYRIGCVDRLGLIARAVIIWDKPNGLPESVTDRVRRSHEDWVHLTKQPRYYSAVDEVREAHLATGKATRPQSDGWKMTRSETDRAYRANGWTPDTANPLGKLPSSVWTIPSEPLQVPPELGVEHFAAYPTEWPRRIIAGWSPPGICTACGEGRRPVARTDYSHTTERGGDTGRAALRDVSGLTKAYVVPRLRPETTITGYACVCTPYTDHPGIGGSHKRTGNTMLDGEGWASTNELDGSYQNYQRVGPAREYHFDRWTPAPTRPAIVLDPFVGTGTTVLVADVLGRHGIGVDLSADYCRLATWRTRDPASRAKAARVDKPPPVIDGQLDLLGGVW